MLEEKVSNRFTIDFVMKMLEKVYKNEKLSYFVCILDSLRPVRVLEKFQ